jgi:methyl-accepting chemotaxis protein
MQWFYNLKIASKLIASFLMVAIIAGAVGAVGILNINKIDKSDTELYEKMTVPISIAADMSKNFQRIRVNVREMILAETPVDVDLQYQEIKQIIASMNELSNEFEKTIISDVTMNAFKEFLGTRAEFQKNLEQMHKYTLENRDQEAMAFLNKEMKVASDAEQNAIEKLVQLKVEDASAKSEVNSATADQAVISMIVMICIGMGLAIGLGYFISRIISRPLGKMVQAAEQIANGDLNVHIQAVNKDEVGILASAFEKMTANMNDVMTNISEAAEQVASGSSQVSESSMALSQGATEQASSIEQLTASLEEISAQTKLNAESANSANAIAEAAKETAQRGNEQMKGMLKAMDEINDASGNISKIIKVIDEIAFQTNILALNAAVEAARAGQHGKGFAVVAEEVRNLAARSANAAKETTDMIEGSIKKVEGGMRIANDTADALSQIVDGVAKVASLVGDIAMASNEQASGVAQINQGITQVSQVVQANSATSEESAAASEELSSQAELLKVQVQRFSLRKVSGDSSYYKRVEEFSPEMLRMLENLNGGNRRAVPESRSGKTEPAKRGKLKIALSDSEFGKY